MQMIQVRLGDGIPVVLLCLENGHVAFAKAFGFYPVIDLSEPDKVGGAFWIDKIEFTSITGTVETYQYNTTYDYKQQPLMLAWLQQQHLQSPQF